MTACLWVAALLTTIRTQYPYCEYHATTPATEQIFFHSASRGDVLLSRSISEKRQGTREDVPSKMLDWSKKFFSRACRTSNYLYSGEIHRL